VHRCERATVAPKLGKLQRPVRVRQPAVGNDDARHGGLFAKVLAVDLAQTLARQHLINVAAFRRRLRVEFERPPFHPHLELALELRHPPRGDVAPRADVVRNDRDLHRLGHA
jgi:hypothetical protein